jgi:hypothetical protein
MRLVRRFVVTELLWAIGIFIPMVAIAALGEPLSAEHLLPWLARAFGLAAFPAGIAIAPLVFGDSQPWRQVAVAVGVAFAVGVLVFALTGMVAPLVSEQSRALGELAGTMRNAGESWETRNDAAWAYYTTFLSALNAVLFALIGAQVGYWADHSVPRSLQRPLYWAVGLGLLVTGLAMWDTTYETIVLHTAADASNAAFYTVLVPGFVFAGLSLPTLAVLRRAVLPKQSA